MTEYADQSWTSPDGLRLHYRDYPGPADRPPVICLPGLTRNARDFAPVAEAFAGEWRFICPDLRGRGDSEYARDAMTYVPRTYLGDLEALFEQAALDRFVLIGTSLGGLLTMLLAAARPERIAAAVLNDVGPRLEPEGLARVRENVGRGGTFPTWMHAAWALRDIQGEAFPDYSVSDWLDQAKRRMELGSGGRISFAYDMKIAEAFAKGPPPSDTALWPPFEALKGRPVLAVRGGLSDLLSAKTLAEMKKRLPGLETVTIKRAGHAPSLAEPQSLAAIRRLLDKLA